MNKFSGIAFLALFAGASLGQGETVQAILTRMDASQGSFRSVECGYKRSKLTAIINDLSEEIGSMRMLKTGGKVQVWIELTKPDSKLYSLTERKAEIYYPKIKTVQEYDLGKQKGVVEQFLLLGFGTSGKELTKSYTIKMLGEEPVEGQNTTRLELAPKSDKVKEFFTKVEIWIPNGAAHAVRQKFFERSGDTTTVTYSNVKLNPPLTADSVRLQLPPNTKREFPQK
jgi:outer membrane lipoprotein-sorting protein